MLNSVQKAAYELIQADARFLYTLTVIQRNAKNISSNYIIGFPAMTAWLGSVHALERKIRLSAGFADISFYGAGVVVHNYQMHTYRLKGNINNSLSITANPLIPNSFSMPSSLESMQTSRGKYFTPADICVLLNAHDTNPLRNGCRTPNN